MNNSIRTKIAIVTTVADASEHIDFFIKYHLSIGIKHIFIFIDDSCEETFKRAARYVNVTPVYVNEETRENWKLVPAYSNSEKRTLRNREVMVRQEYNAYLGYSLAKSIGIDWLLHIDIDELFYPNGVCLDDHFTELQKNNNGGCVYLNYEAIPVKQESHCIYRSTQFFKKNYFKKGQWFFSEAQRSFIQSEDWLSDFFFNYYQNGKSAANLHYELVLSDVHAMWGKGTDLAFLGHKDPIILHFPSITLTEFNKKYKRLGYFDDYWKGFLRVGKFIDPLHLDARDKFSSNSKDFEKLFESRIMLNQYQIDTLLNQDLAVKIDDIVSIDFSSTNFDTELPLLSMSNNPSSSIAKKSNLAVLHTTFSDLLRRNSVSRITMDFGSFAEARMWLRRHPVLSRNILACHISESFPFTIYCNHLCLYDFSNPNLKSALKTIVTSFIDSGKAVLFKMDDTVFLKDYEHKTEFDIAMDAMNFMFDLANSLDQEQADNVFFEVPYGKEAHLLACKKLNLFDSRLSFLIEQSLHENSPYSLALYIAEHYPRHTKFNWALDASIFNNYPNEQKNCIFSILYSLGGTILNDVKQRNSINVFSLVREKNPFIYKNYSRLIFSGDENLIILHKENNENV